MTPERTPMATRPPMIRTDASNAFAHHTMRVRAPGNLQDVLDLNPDYPPSIRDALKALHDDCVNDAPLKMLELPAPDYDEWAAAFADRAGESWHNTVWFFAESFLYRHAIQAVRWWDTGRDPFAPKKEEEYAGSALWELLERAVSLTGSAEERLSQLMGCALWGNRIDLSYAAVAQHGGESLHDDDLLVDDRPRAIETLLRKRGVVHIVADNAGTELTLDMALVDALLETAADRVILHLKLHPTFVSDAMPADVLSLLERAQFKKHAGLYGRLRAALDSGRLRLAPDLFWNSSRMFWALPPRLTQTFQGAPMVILKGDANYRRLVGDAIWPPETPFAEAAAYFPTPLLTLRTLKSDPIVGLPAGLATKLDALDPAWHVNGRRGLIQMTG